MALADWQRHLAAMLAAPAGSPPVPETEGFSDSERAWLEVNARHPGVHVTREIQRHWRRIRLSSSLPLTMAALPPDVRDELVDAYLDALPCVSFFHAHEGRQFARFIAPRPVGHAVSLAALEVAIADVADWQVFARDEPPRAPQAASRLYPHPAATRVRFSAAPERVIGSVLAGTEPPLADSDHHELLVAPGIPNFGRLLDETERTVLDACTDGAQHRTLTERSSATHDAVTRLLAERGLIASHERQPSGWAHAVAPRERR